MGGGEEERVKERGGSRDIRGEEVYEEVMMLDEENNDLEAINRVWASIEIGLLICMFALMLLCVVAERPRPWSYFDKEVIGLMVCFVFCTPIAHLVCFIVSIIIYFPLWIIGKKNLAHRISCLYPWIKHLVEAKLLIVCFIFGIKLILRGSFDDKLYHMIFFIAMLIMCLIFFILRAAWFFTSVKKEERTEHLGPNKYRLKGGEQTAHREEVKKLLANMDDAQSVKNGMKLEGPLEGI